MREIIFDTETTGIHTKEGHRLVEIGCVELFRRVATGVTFHAYINPEREMPEEIAKIHGLKDDFLSTQPVFADIADQLLAFIGDKTPLIAHNAPFDVKFINAEMERIGKPRLAKERVVDTLKIARAQRPKRKNTLDALCDHYMIDRSKRINHGALLDSFLLAEVYAKLRPWPLELTYQGPKL